MDPQILNVLIAVVVGVAALAIVRSLFKIINLGLNLVLLIVLVVAVYLLLRGGA